MITIKYSNYDQEVKDIEERLKDMSLAFKLKKEDELGTPVFEDVIIRVEGQEKIKAELDKLQEELKQWWYCSC